MQKSKSAKAAAKSSPDKLIKAARKVSFELTEGQLGQATGGGKIVKIHF